MFLDDELLQMCIECEANTPEKIQQLNRDLCKKCMEYYKSKLDLEMTKKEAKIILDKTFNLFNSFVRMAKKSDNYKVQELGKMFEKFTFKKQFLADEKIDKLYKNLSIN